jgi:hypothetical protein
MFFFSWTLSFKLPTDISHMTSDQVKERAKKCDKWFGPQKCYVTVCTGGYPLVLEEPECRVIKKTLITNKRTKGFFINCKYTLLHVSTLLGHLQGETFRCLYTRLHYTVERECAVDCASQQHSQQFLPEDDRAGSKHVEVCIYNWWKNSLLHLLVITVFCIIYCTDMEHIKFSHYLN